MTSPRSEIARILELPRADRTAGQFRERAYLFEMLRRLGPEPLESFEDTGTARNLPGAAWLLDDQITFLAACIAAADVPPTDNGRRGVLGFMSCGCGKTLSLQLAPHIFRAARPVLLTEANLIPQLRADLARWRDVFDLAEPEVVSYGKLSHPTGRGLLERLQPDLILCDEGHKIGAAKPGARGSARSLRLWEYVEEHRDTAVVIVSGSLMNRSVYDVADAASLTLREGSPLPFNPGILEHWASVLDILGEASDLDRDALRPLVAWCEAAGLYDGIPISPRPVNDFRTRARAAFRARLQTAPGVVCTTGPLDVGASLSLQMVDPIPSPELKHLDTTWELPDGTELVDSLEYYRHARTLRLGFYYRWDPTTVDDEWMARRKYWGAVVRDYVETGQFETPYFVCDGAERSILSSSAMVAYHRWVDIRSRVAPPEREAIWLPEGRERLFELVARWRADRPTGVVWYHSRALEELRWAEQGARLVRASDSPPAHPSAPSVMMSLAHRQGWNGHAYTDALVLEPPTSAREMEQLIARHHRTGQFSDVSFALVGTYMERESMGAQAWAVVEMTGTPQRFLLADWVESVKA